MWPKLISKWNRAIFFKIAKFHLICEVSSRIPLQKILRKGDPITSYLCSGGLIRGAYHNILKFNYNLYSSSLDVYQKRCVLYKLLISLRCMNESPTVAACVSTGSRRCVYKSFSLSRFTKENNLIWPNFNVPLK